MIRNVLSFRHKDLAGIQYMGLPGLSLTGPQTAGEEPVVATQGHRANPLFSLDFSIVTHCPSTSWALAAKALIL